MDEQTIRQNRTKNTENLLKKCLKIKKATIGEMDKIKIVI